jgi:hypothetical protein
VTLTSPDVRILATPQDTVTGFLLAGVGDKDAKQRINYLIVKNGMLCRPEDPGWSQLVTDRANLPYCDPQREATHCC